VQAESEWKAWTLLVDGGPFAIDLALGVADPVFDFECGPAGVSDRRGGATGLDSKAALGVEELGEPLKRDLSTAYFTSEEERGDTVVQGIVTWSGPARQLDQDPVCAAQSPVGAPAVFPGACETYGPAVDVDSTGDELAQFGREDFLKSESAGGDELKHGGRITN
jgi:hypothetical protein